MRYYKKLLYLTLTISALFAQSAVEPDSLYEIGNQAMLQEDFAIAIDNYEQILNQVTDPQVLAVLQTVLGASPGGGGRRTRSTARRLTLHGGHR